ncbi:hypothetical protein J5S49_17920 [Virgibacillus halodenitrificans]|uniref:Uncharacterized protein n=1 Tax=Virgibacillus halodenitrificans TaxID=1482 RepID=A0AAC9IYS3_VIRHA|nr:hypothetical protein [Virgibacillus halodenitrificans]APC47487.1 hypothetical protein BME96_04570 [Virgibacillus halodenitrificans]MBD1221770.1 hypothetical protein [Virgibacillus halodenitrificans]MCG1030164.1 hypothetical protein [Virgibacillus halodenitrificans]MEC2158621.1 hypothetical protein [Virgibacillus halodenitrificans]MYL56549.1 hypothetical protein [Virgibacillus halodenitrificans]
MKKCIMLIIVISLLAGCSEKGSQVKEDEETEGNAVSFRNIDVKVEGGNVRMTGEVNSDTSTFYYKLKQNEKTLVNEKNKKYVNMEWQKFTIEFKLPDNIAQDGEPPFLLLYGKNEAGEVINPNYFPLDLDS